MHIDVFCDLYSVANRDRISAKKFFGDKLDVDETTWINKFEGHFALGRAGKPQLKELLSKSMDELKDLCKQYPEDEWSSLDNKAKLAKYLSNKS